MPDLGVNVDEILAKGIRSLANFKNEETCDIALTSEPVT